MWDNSGLLSERNLRFMQETYADVIHNVWWLCLAMALCCGYAAMAMRNLNLDDTQEDGHGVAASCAASVYTTEVRSPIEKEDARSLIRYSAPPGSFKPGKPASQRSSVQRSSVQRSSIQPSVQRSSLQPSVARSSVQRSSLRSGVSPRLASSACPASSRHVEPVVSGSEDTQLGQLCSALGPASVEHAPSLACSAIARPALTCSSVSVTRGPVTRPPVTGS